MTWVDIKNEHHNLEVVIIITIIMEVKGHMLVDRLYY